MPSMVKCFGRRAGRWRCNLAEVLERVDSQDRQREQDEQSSGETQDQVISHLRNACCVFFEALRAAAVDME